MRQFYAKRAKGEHTSLTDERVEALNEVSICVLHSILYLEWWWRVSVKLTYYLWAHQLGFVWSLKSVRAESKARPPPQKKRKLQPQQKQPVHPAAGIVEVVDYGSSKKATTSSCAGSVISTEVLPDGTHVIRTEEDITHLDGSTVATATEESSKRRTIRLAGGTRILETTTRIVITKTERVVLPSAPPAAVDESTTTKEVVDTGDNPTAKEKDDAELDVAVPPLSVNENNTAKEKGSISEEATKEKKDGAEIEPTLPSEGDESNATKGKGDAGLSNLDNLPPMEGAATAESEGSSAAVKPEDNAAETAQSTVEV